MADEYSLSIQHIESLEGDALLREIGKQVIFIRRKLDETYQKMIEVEARLKSEK